MGNAIHHLKIRLLYFKAIKQGVKDWELRKDDRGFEVGDKLLLHPYENGKYLDIAVIVVEIKYIFSDINLGLTSGYCILSIKPSSI